MKHKVEGHPHLVKDSETGVILNRENSDRTRYRMAKQQAMMNMESQNEIARLSDEMNEIKGLLQKLLNK